ncbi:hypothetical protein E3N88_44163 [Mikania micrantha]|uniref:Uncharacterized protein n=1 Tax=Mikania micrantha TaxID=192012 RepID=A0A5N6LCV5_9ASTR|nr:hypothetical protein E3N88_44163 [Mikania micrantha]
MQMRVRQHALGFGHMELQLGRDSCIPLAGITALSMWYVICKDLWPVVAMSPDLLNFPQRIPLFDVDSPRLPSLAEGGLLLAGWSCMSGNFHVRLREKGGGQNWRCCTSLSSSLGSALSFLGEYANMILTTCGALHLTFVRLDYYRRVKSIGMV